MPAEAGILRPTPHPQPPPAKTHLPYLVWIIDSTTKLWRTPNGLWRIVDHQGTHHPETLELGPELLAG